MEDILIEVKQGDIFVDLKASRFGIVLQHAVALHLDCGGSTST